MDRPKPTESEMWRLINQTELRKDQIRHLDDFKSSAVNFKIALWNPDTNGVRYLKALIYNLCKLLSHENRKRMLNIKNRHVGKPFAVRYDGMEICLDYLQ